MYRYKKGLRSTISSCDVVEGETIEHKIMRIVENKEPIKDGAPEIFTERKEGVIAAYNIRTDRFEIAADAMDAVSRSREAKRDSKPDLKVVDKDVSEGKPTEGKGPDLQANSK